MIDWIWTQIQTNQFLSGAIGGSLSYTILANIKSWFLYFHSLFMNHFTRTITMNDSRNQKLVETFLEALKSHKKKPKTIQVNRINKKTIKSIGYGIHYIWYKWFTLVKVHVQKETRENGYRADYISLYITFVGLNTDQLRDDLVDKVNDIYGTELDDNRYIYECYEGAIEKKMVRKYRPLESVFVNEDSNIKELIKKIESLFNSSNDTIYDKIGHAKKLGILLYGAPGCGKSSLIQAISSYFNKDVYYIQLTDNTSSIIYSLDAIAKDLDSKCIIVYEDFDCVSLMHEREEKAASSPSTALLPRILQQLDGIGLPEKSVIIATTNHYEKLDSAIKRDGRFDIKIEVTPASRQTADKMAEFYNISDRSILDTVNYPCPQATLQKMMFDQLRVENKI